MDINAALVGQTIIVLAVIFAIVGFYLGKRKTETPLLVSILALFSALMPPIGLIFLMVLALKKDLPSAN
ncbi:hypothetical protein SAMN04488070_0777 [Pseudidiomarina maritima]|uniref:Uncharacterized protein n=1 Tax=Pseudidiomarina maritima TaxID=519453 RepID=A0A1I6GIQ8_9GAMM|nr:hypothetical protein [Pseudidiomarina maritima]PHS60124.1 MAG: hypothetical protein COB00_16725 [Alcanivorax sp.]SFR42060.1 hypothetical protein SAMN04488070_0777 [Pseudidiomarina maritima]